MRPLVASGATSAVVHAGAIVGLLLFEPSSNNLVIIDLTIMPASEMSMTEALAGGTPGSPTVAPALAPTPPVAVRMRPSPRAARPTRAPKPISPTPTEPSLEPAPEAATPAHEPLPASPAAAADPSSNAVAGPPGGVAAAGIARGGGAAPGTASPAGSGGGGQSSAQQAYLAKHYAYIREAIQRSAIYPALARRMGWVGRVVLAFRVLPDGAVANVRVKQGSGFQLLDVSATEAVRRASPFPPPPAEAEIVAPVAYSLE